MDSLLHTLVHGPESGASMAMTLVFWMSRGVVFGTLLALLTWALTSTVLRRAGSGVHALFWTIVLLKFLVPLGPAWVMSFENLVAWATPPAFESAAGRQIQSEVRLGGVSGTPLLVPQRDAAEQASPASPGASDVSGMLAPILGGYALVITALAVRRGIAHLRFARRCAQLPPASGDVRDRVRDVVRRMGLHRAPDVRIASGAASPLIFGVLRPTLVLPRRVLESTLELEAILLHELAHLRRGDLWIRHLQLITGTLLFFWPVVAWVNRRLDLARENACDEWALRHGRLTPGEYARCLLRAMTPAGAPRCVVRPAAMAANLKQVERRIDMILRSETASGRRSVRVLGGGLALAWGSVMLTGAVTPPQPDSAKPQTVTEDVIVLAGDDGAPQQFAWVTAGDAPDGVMQWHGAHAPIVMHAMHGDGDASFTGVWIAGPSDAELAEFLAARPASDLNGDGTLTPVERDAYVSAMALAAPTDVLAQFPFADLDKDGVLGAAEAARLVTTGMFEHRIEAMKVEPRFITLKLDGSDLPASGEIKTIVKLEGAESGATLQHDVQVLDDGRFEVRIVRSNDAGGEDGAAPQGEFEWVRADAAGECVQAALPQPPALPARWIQDNVDASPTTAEASVLVTMVERAPLDHFLELNPDADLDRDGTLTADERDTYTERRMSEHRQRLLEKFPQADANGDGILTTEELHAHFASQHAGDTMLIEGADGQRRMIRMRAEKDGE